MIRRRFLMTDRVVRIFRATSPLLCPVRDAYTVQPAAAPPDQTRCHEGPRFISTVPRQKPPAPHLIRFPVWPAILCGAECRANVRWLGAELFNFLPCRRRCRTDSQILVLALQRSPAPGVCQKRWEMRWPPRAGCVHATTIHFDRPPAGAPAPHLIRFPVWAGLEPSSPRPLIIGIKFSAFSGAILRVLIIITLYK